MQWRPEKQDDWKERLALSRERNAAMQVTPSSRGQMTWIDLACEIPAHCGAIPLHAADMEKLAGAYATGESSGGLPAFLNPAHLPSGNSPTRGEMQNQLRAHGLQSQGGSAAEINRRLATERALLVLSNLKAPSLPCER